MSEPIEVSKKPQAAVDGEAWNAFIDLISRNELQDLTPVQRIARLTWWYSSEVLNGGHDQYFGNNKHIDHWEVIPALVEIGAEQQSQLLVEVLDYYRKARTEMPDGYDEYIAWERNYGYDDQMRQFDSRFHDCRPEIDALLEAYLQQHEDHFIKWVP